MILYFSATGNSRFVAEQLAEQLDDEAVSLLPKLRSNDRSPVFSDKPWVIVSPVYVADMAQLVEGWVRGTPLRGSKDIYFVFTAAADMGISGLMQKDNMKEKGMNYKGSTCITMPTNYPVFFTVKEPDECVEIIRASLPKIAETAGIIRDSGILPEEKLSPAMIAAIKPVKKLYYGSWMKADDFYTNGSCIGCGTCTRVCPMCNITMLGKWPQWSSKCTHCMACLSNCPVEAIEYGKKTPGKRKYHFPDRAEILEGTK